MTKRDLNKKTATHTDQNWGSFVSYYYKKSDDGSWLIMDDNRPEWRTPLCPVDESKLIAL